MARFGCAILLLVSSFCRIIEADNPWLCNRDGYFGRSCRFQCHCKHFVSCDKETGKCPSDCADGYWGGQCLLTSQCSYNDGVPCGSDIVSSGTCTGGHYLGKVSHVNGVRCENWSDHGGYPESDFSRLDGSRAAAKNYCRHPRRNDAARPWCYAQVGGSHWALCAVHLCDCPKYRYGTNCEKECLCYDINEECDAVTGSCPRSGLCWKGLTGTDCNTACRAGTFGVNCEYTCHCRGSAVCDKDTGACPLPGCEYGWSGEACQIGNGAQGKNAAQSSTRQFGTGTRLGAGLAVDNNTNQGLTTGGSCSCTNTENKPWWRVDLGHRHVLFNLTIHDIAIKLKEIKIWMANEDKVPTTDEHLCHYFGGFAKTLVIDCTRPVIGRFLFIKSQHDNAYLSFCEVVIRAFQYTECPYKEHGPSCIRKCQCRDATEKCDVITGRCPVSGCNDKYGGGNCQTEILCDKPDLRDGTAITTSLKAGGSVQFGCNEGFVLEGTASSTCIKDGTGVKGKWRDPVPICTVITCDKPVLENGGANCSKLEYGATATYGCNEGYILEGSATSSCVSSGPTDRKGKWSNPTPRCIEITCAEPALLNGNVKLSSTNVGSTIEYKCNDGYIIEGEMNSTCVGNGTGNAMGEWSNPPPICTEITCEPPSLPNGNVSLSSWKFGDTVAFMCNKGYVLEGTVNSTCISNGTGNPRGTWSNPTPTCTEITCDEPVFPFGNLSSSAWEFGDTVEFMCNEGYVLEGTVNSTCISNDTGSPRGEWSNPTPTCTEITCDEPVLLFGNLSSSSSSFGDTVDFMCSEGYVLEGNVNSTCISNGTGNPRGKWSNPTPTCTEITCVEPTLPFGNLSSSSSSFGDTVDFMCNQGYVLEGNVNSTCISNGTGSPGGTWSNTTPTCAEITCDEPTLPFDNLSSSAWKFGDTVDFMCNKGYVLEGNVNSTCNSNGTGNLRGKWSNPTPTCIEITCDEPVLPFGNLSSSSSSFGDTVDFMCNEGYVLKGNVNSTCISNGTGNPRGKWSNPTPTCTGITCDEPVLLFGNLSSSSSSFGETVEFMCNEGYVLEGNGNSTCISINGTGNPRGEWSNPTPTCTEITCVEPTLPFGNLSSSSSSFGDTVDFMCNEGYVLEGNVNSTCIGNGTGSPRGTWSNPTPTCTEITCGEPVLLNGNVSNNTLKFGATVTFLCNVGYVLDGRLNSTCVSNGTGNRQGQWSNLPPICTEITCEPLALLNGNANASSARFGATIQYMCKDGYVLEGKVHSTCVHDGTENPDGRWSNPVPTCTEIVCTQMHLPNGNVSVSDRKFGATIQYMCNDGYVLKGKTNSTCVQDGTASPEGKWSNQVPTCIEITCEFPSLLNGNVSSSSTTFGSTATHICNEGYILEGKMNATCVNNGTGNQKGMWSNPSPACIAITCELPMLLNGNVIVNSTNFGAMIKFTCNDGYVLEGNVNSTCVHNGTENRQGKWSDAGPMCTEITCERPTLPNGNISSTPTAAFGSTIQYTCNDGCILEGNVNSTCVHNGNGNREGKWSNPPPACIEITCELPTLQHGNVTVSSIRFGATIKYTCNDGYVLEGTMDSTCVHSGIGNRQGQWSNPTPTCTEITCPAPLIPNGRATTDSLKFGGTGTYLCDEGFALKGKTTSTCIASDGETKTGRWSDPVPICSEITCDQPFLQNGSTTAESLGYGGTVKYSCDDGYILEGAARTTCGIKGSEEGNWQDPKPTCKEITCDRPTHPDNGVAVADSLKLGGTVRYFCSKGYVLNGNKDLSTCLRNGTMNARGKWSNRAPICTAALPDHGTVRSLESISPGNNNGFGGGVGCGIGIMLLILLVVYGICILVRKRKYIAELRSSGFLKPIHPEKEKECRDFHNPVYCVDETETYKHPA